MATSAEIQMLRNADPGAVLPGIDAPVGNQTNLSLLKGLSSIPRSSAPMIYNPTTNVVYIVQNGADVSGYNFGSATVVVAADNVTIENSTFSGTTGWYAVQEYAPHTGLTVKNSTFTGGYGTHVAFIITPGTSVNTITGNWFIAASGDAVDAPGTITGNYFQGGGYSAIHSDAIWVTNSSVPTRIANNLIDWTYNLQDGTQSANNAVRITTELGSVSNVTVTNNFLLGGSNTIDAGSGVHGSYVYSNINIANNYIGFGRFGAFYPGAMQGVTASGNAIFDFTNRAYSDQAWAAYRAAGIPSANLVVASGSVGWVKSAATGSSTIYGNDVAQAHLGGTANLTNFVGGAGVQYLGGGTGKNIFTYLAVSDSWSGGADMISSFDPAKDVIDLSHLDAGPATPGVQSFKFIGTTPFSSSGGEVRSWYDATKSLTWVEADLAGGGPNPSTDLLIRIAGNPTLTASNFALTSAQSAAALAGAASASAGGGTGGSPASNVTGSSSQAYYGPTSRVAMNFDLGAANNLVLSGSGLTVTRGAGSETLQVPGPKAPSVFTLPYHANETIDATAGKAETFAFSSGFGGETIKGVSLTGPAADTIKFAASAFSYLTAGMTQAQDLAAVLAHATSGPSGVTLFDSAGDALCLPGLGAAMISASASRFQFV